MKGSRRPGWDAYVCMYQHDVPLAVTFDVGDGGRGTHEHENMTMADRCGELWQQLAAAERLQ